MKNGASLRVLAGCGALFLVGCTDFSVPDQARLSSLSRDGSAAVGRRDDVATALAQSEEGNADVLASFGDSRAGDASASTLPTLVKAALDRNADIGRAAQAISTADAQHLNAVFGYLPQMYVTVSRESLHQRVIESDNSVYEEGDTRYPVVDATATLKQPIYDMSRIFGIKYARNAQSVAEVEYIGQIRDVTYEVIDNYIIAGQASNRMRALRQRQTLYDRQITGRTGLEQAGLDDDIESASLRSERSSIGAELALESARYAEAVANLSLLTGTVVNDVTTVRFPKGVAGTERRISVAEAVRQGQENNPAIMSAALSVVGADLDRRRAKAAEYMPVLDAYATLEREDRADSRFGGGSLTQDTAIGVSLTVPIFNADGKGYPSREKASELRASTMGYYARRRSVESEIRTTHARMGDLSRAVAQSAASAKEARRALEGERNLQASGQSVDLAVAARELRFNKAQEQVSYYQAEYLRSWARLQYLMGAEMTNIGL